MAKITLQGNAVNTVGELPSKGSQVSGFKLVKTDLSEVTLDSYGAKRKVLNIFPSVDTSTCAMSVRQFNQRAASLDNTVVLNISADLPFALKRFCGVEGIDNAEALSAFRSDFPREWGLEIADGPLKGLCSRAVIVLDGDNRVLHAEQVAEIADEPDYEAAVDCLNS